MTHPVLLPLLAETVTRRPARARHRDTIDSILREALIEGLFARD